MANSTFNFTSRLSPGDTVYAVVPDGGRCADRDWDEYIVSPELRVYAVVARPEVGGLKLSYVAVTPTPNDDPPKGEDWEPHADDMVFTSRREAEACAKRKSRENRPNRTFSVEVHARLSRNWTIAVTAIDAHEAREKADTIIRNGDGDPRELTRALHDDCELSCDDVDIESVTEIDDPSEAVVDCTEEE